MIPASEIRICEYRDAEGNWHPCTLAQLTEGDVVRFFEPDGLPVLRKGEAYFVVKERASLVIELETEVIPQAPIEEEPQ